MLDFYRSLLRKYNCRVIINEFKFDVIMLDFYRSLLRKYNCRVMDELLIFLHYIPMDGGMRNLTKLLYYILSIYFKPTKRKSSYN